MVTILFIEKKTNRRIIIIIIILKGISSEKKFSIFMNVCLFLSSQFLNPKYITAIA